jgi:hypothetical protein
MAGLVPAIHVLRLRDKKDVDGRDKPGHDELWCFAGATGGSAYSSTNVTVSATLAREVR